MESYNKYVNRLKQHDENINYYLIYEKIKDKISANKRIFYMELGSAFAGSALIMFLCLFAYLNYAGFQVRSTDYLTGYVLSQPALNGNQVMNYVFY